jgi:hypothetical protein
MEIAELLWLLAYAFQMLMTNLTYYFMYVNLRNKPLVSQSIFDQALLDSFMVSMF